MCGVCGYFSTEPGTVEPQAIEDMFAATEQRGTDASGYVASVHDRLRSVKLPLKSSKFMLADSYDGNLLAEADTWIGHCRLATHGPAKFNKNNHPFIHKGLGLIHNGIIGNYDYGLEDDERIDLTTDCDSEAILKLITYYRAQGLKTSEAIGKASTELDGTMACALINREGAMWLWRRDEGYGMSPLWLAYHDTRKLVQFGSTQHLLDKSLDKSGWTVYNVPSGLGFLLRPKDDGDFGVTPFEVPACAPENMGYGVYGIWDGSEYSRTSSRSRFASSYYRGKNAKRSSSVSSLLEEDVAEAKLAELSKEKEADGYTVFGLTKGKWALEEMTPLTFNEICEVLDDDEIFWCFKCDDYVGLWEFLGHYVKYAHTLFMVDSWETDETALAATYDPRTGKITSFSDYCSECGREFLGGEQRVLGMCASCAYFSAEWECS